MLAKKRSSFSKVTLSQRPQCGQAEVALAVPFIPTTLKYLSQEGQLIKRIRLVTANATSWLRTPGKDCPSLDSLASRPVCAFSTTEALYSVSEAWRKKTLILLPPLTQLSASAKAKTHGNSSQFDCLPQSTIWAHTRCRTKLSSSVASATDPSPKWPSTDRIKARTANSLDWIRP